MQWDSNIGDTVCRPLFHSISFSPTFSGIKMHEIIDIYIYKISTLSACNQRSTMCTVLKISFFFFYSNENDRKMFGEAMLEKLTTRNDKNEHRCNPSKQQ